MRRITAVCLGVALAFSVTMIGCYRGKPSDKPPVHLVPNMDRQEKYKAQAEGRFFPDGSAMRVPVAGTVARGYLREDTEYYQGKNEKGEFIQSAPVDVDMALMERGRERYDIYCSPCHGRVGDGHGIVASKGFVPPPSFHLEHMREMPDGRIYDVISNGKINMPAYRHQIPPDDRWAIVAYFRALQRSRNASSENIPEDVRRNLDGQ